MREGKPLIERCDTTETAWERMAGLLPRKALARDEALWIAPCTSIHTFFMRFPIDVAFLDKKGKVLAIYENMPPWRHSWIHPFAAGVLEASAGLFREADLKKGEVLEICHTS
jgi:uncharacterized membrane protein (UPF0127 family)